MAIIEEKTIDLIPEKWVNQDDNSLGTINNNGLLFANENNHVSCFQYKKKMMISNSKAAFLCIKCKGDTSIGAAGYVSINGIEVSVNGEAVLPLAPPQFLRLEVIINANSALTLSSITISILDEDYNLCDNINKEADVLVITPAYPSHKNLYMAAFAHARNRAYVAKGLKIQVAALSNNYYPMSYSIDGIPVFRGNRAFLKTLLSKKQYKTIVVHFVDEEIMSVFDGYISNEKMIFICHGPETLFEVLPNKVRPYFTKPLPAVIENNLKKDYIKKYAKKENVEWVFVSEWLKKESEKVLSTSFLHAQVIGNYINDNIFSYHEKKPEDRKKILVLRKFDNICQHSIDQVVFAIRELARRPFFNELSFSFYGDGDYYDELLEPIKEFDNIKFYRTFLPQPEIAKIHKEHGIILLPSRHDAHAVSMSEGASSGLVVIGSNVTSNPYYMDDENNHTMVDPEDPIALADVVERLYNNPDEFLTISKRLSEFVHEVSSEKNTVEREVDLIKKSLQTAQANWDSVSTIKNVSEKEPVLTVLVAAYNVEPWIDKCIRSLINHPNAHMLEILVVNDGSSDNTSAIAHKYEDSNPRVVRVIDKDNGGHGSTINIGISEARGKYFRIVDGDDWVDSDNFSSFLDLLAEEEADVVLTEGSYEYSDKTGFETIIEYNMLNENVLYRYDDLLFPNYGFDNYGPLLTTGTYKTELLRKADFQLSEKKPYVDMEFNAFSQRYINTLKYFKLDIYRYLIGREGQTISREYWKSKYKVHASIIINILETLDKMDDFPQNRRSFINGHLIAMMVDSQIFMYDQVCHREEIEPFLKELEKWPDAKEASLNYIRSKNAECNLILKKYKKVKGSKPIIKTTGSMRVRTKAIRVAKRAVKAVVPENLRAEMRKELNM